jgi:F-type H+-transporting ATPase subunit delta
MAKITPRQYAVALFESTKNVKGSKLNEVLKSFIILLAKSHKIKLIEKIIEELNKYANEQEGIEQAEVITAKEIDQKTEQAIKKVFGGKIDMKKKVDSQIIGGIIIKTQDKILDASLKTQLKKLKETMN